MKNVPKFIYLNIGDDPEEKFEDFQDACETLDDNLTWSKDPIDYHTIKYKLAKDESGLSEKLDKVDDFLMRIEGSLQGKEGKECTECRAVLAKLRDF